MKLTNGMLGILVAVCTSPVVAHTDNYQDFYRTSGCRLMLCLQNPNGPMSVQECQQDVQAFFTELALAYYGHDVSIPICTPSLTNGSFFTIGTVSEFVKVERRDTISYEWRPTGMFAVSTYIGNKPWRQWGFSGRGEKLTETGLLSQMGEKKGRFLRVTPFSTKDIPKWGPYAQALTNKVSYQDVPNEKLLNKIKNQTGKFSSQNDWFGNRDTRDYIDAWMKSTGYSYRNKGKQ